MAKNIIILFSVFFASFLSVNGQNDSTKIVLNHLLIIVDSTTYQEILKSKIINTRFAYAHEKKLQGYSGIYVIGQDNYIEIFNPKSIDNEYHKPGTSWICYASMRANFLKKMNSTCENKFEFSSDNEFDYLTLYFKDSSNLIEAWEMKQSHYENWAKKEFHDSVSFLSSDYNSPAESDSTKNYEFTNVIGMKVLVNEADSIHFRDFMQLMGYSRAEHSKNIIVYSNSVDFIEVDFRANIQLPTITKVYMTLKNEVGNEKRSERIEIGNSTLSIEGNRATWDFKRGDW